MKNKQFYDMKVKEGRTETEKTSILFILVGLTILVLALAK